MKKGAVKKGSLLQTMRNSWWVILLFFLCALIYERAIEKKNGELDGARLRLAKLYKERENLSNEREDLLLRLNSQSDPAWIEMVLMRELGVVPEGKRKIHFKND